MISLRKKTKSIIIGDAKNQFIKYLFKHIRDEDVDLEVGSVTSADKSYYDGALIDFSSKLDLVLPFFNTIIVIIKMYFFFFIFGHRYKSINIQYISGFYYFLIKTGVIKKEQLIISFWGSDINNLQDKNLYKIKYIIEKSKLITCATEDVKKKLIERFSLNENLILVIKYGLEPLEYIKNNSLSRLECKHLFGIESEKITIVIGYNASKNQQHIKIIQVLKEKLPGSLLNRIKFILPLTYGRDEEYISTLKNEFSGLNVLFLEKYLTDKDVSSLRILADIFINLQVHDVFSGSMQEHLYAQGLVITGSWLNYVELRNYENFIEISDIDLIGEKICEILHSNIISSRSETYIKDIYDLSSWNVLKKKWAAIIK